MRKLSRYLKLSPKVLKFIAFAAFAEDIFLFGACALEVSFVRVRSLSSVECVEIDRSNYEEAL